MSNTAAHLTPAQRAAQTRKRNTVQRNVQTALDTVRVAVCAVSDLLCDESAWAGRLGPASVVAVETIDTALRLVRTSQETIGAQPLHADDVDALLDLRNVLTQIVARQASTTPFVVDALTDADGGLLNTVHTAERTMAALAVDYARQVRWQDVDPNTRDLIAQNID